MTDTLHEFNATVIFQLHEIENSQGLGMDESVDNVMSFKSPAKPN